MTVNATDEEREIMKDLYTLFEKVHDMTGTDQEWKDFITEAVRQTEKHKGMARELAYRLFTALIDYKGEQQKARMAEERMRPVQIDVGDIPWN